MTALPKSDLRAQAFAARKTAHATASARLPAATEALLAEIAALAPGISGIVVAGYMPIRTEIDPRPAMAALHAQGAALCVPVIAGPDKPLDFRAWTPDCSLAEGPFGARVPEHGAWLTPEVLITPLVAFDRACNRLGYGGGFYDRTLERLRRASPARAVGFAYAAQELAHIPTEPTDIALDVVITEAGRLLPHDPLPL